MGIVRSIFGCGRTSLTIDNRLDRIRDTVSEALKKLRTSDLTYTTKSEEKEEHYPSKSCGELSLKWMVLGVLTPLQDRYNFTFESEKENTKRFKKAIAYEDLRLYFPRENEHVIIELKYKPFRYICDQFSRSVFTKRLDRNNTNTIAEQWLERDIDTNQIYIRYESSFEESLKKAEEQCKSYSNGEKTRVWFVLGNRLFERKI